MKFNLILSVLSFSLLLCIGGCAHMAQAEDYSVRFGPGIRDNATTGDTKVFGVRREEEVSGGIHDAVEVGGWVDNSGDDRKSSALVKLQLGITPGEEKGLFGKGFFGPCFISTTDSQLGGRFQFCTDIGFGVRDKDTFMGITYGHTSSAGLEMPNHGRDYLVFESGVRF